MRRSFRPDRRLIGSRQAGTRVGLAGLIVLPTLILVTLMMANRPAQAVAASTLAPIATNTPHNAAAASPTVPATVPPTDPPLATLTVPPTITVTPANTFVATAPPGPLGGSDSATWTPASLTLLPNPHFWLARPIGPGGVNYIARNYTYGGTDGGGRPSHHGDDFENPSGTPVLAAGDGVVQYAGDDIHQLFGPQPNFYGNVIVIRHLFTDSNGQAVYSLYGHLSQIGVQAGQQVKAGQIIGEVGSAGVAVGAHLHFEVRVGDPNNYNATRNPELWIGPFSSSGAIAGRLTNLYGQSVGSVKVQFQRQDSFYVTESYVDSGTPGDTQWQETFAISDLQSGYYTVFIKSKDGATLYRNTALVVTGQVTWVGDIHIAQP